MKIILITRECGREETECRLVPSSEIPFCIIYLKQRTKTGVDIDIAQLVTACLVEMLVVGSIARVDVESGWVDGYFSGLVWTVGCVGLHRS